MPEIKESDKPLLSLQHLSFSAGIERKLLLDNITAQILAGDRIALSGVSGAGKSLLLRAIALLEILTQGKILWKGQAIPKTQIPNYRSRVIYLQQRPALGNGTVADCLQQVFSLKAHQDKTYSEIDINQYLNELELDNSFLDKNLQNLSGGEAQITALLRAIQLQPEILLLDEPTAAIDKNKTLAIEKMLDCWFKTPETSHALIWITHDQAQAARVSNKHWQMKQGRLTNFIG